MGEASPTGVPLDQPLPDERVRLVLLVEDDEDDAVLVADLLEGWPDFRVEAVTNLHDAGRRLADGDVHCVLLDLNLPDAVGLEALERLLALRADAAVVVLTGDVDVQRGEAALAAGAQDYLTKERVDGPSLVRAIRYAVERRAAERWRRDLAVARAQEAENDRLQRGLLPAPVLRDPAIGVATAYRPGQRRQLLGGDFYDVVETADGVVHALVGDVCGHGPDEAALGVRLRMAWRTLVLSGTDEDRLFEVLDELLGHERHHDGVFTTVAQVSVTAARDRADVRVAGHPPPFLLAGGRTRALDECRPGPMLGLGLPGTWTRTAVPLRGAWSLVLFTDGLYEGRDADGGRLGLRRLGDLLDAGAGGTPDDGLLQRLITEVERRNRGALTDDVAILAISGTAGA